mgnify:CR=1 FL=1
MSLVIYCTQSSGIRTRRQERTLLRRHCPLCWSSFTTSGGLCVGDKHGVVSECPEFILCSLRVDVTCVQNLGPFKPGAQSITRDQFKQFYDTIRSAGPGVHPALPQQLFDYVDMTVGETTVLQAVVVLSDQAPLLFGLTPSQGSTESAAYTACKPLEPSKSPTRGMCWCCLSFCTWVCPRREEAQCCNMVVCRPHTSRTHRTVFGMAPCL